MTMPFTSGDDWDERAHHLYEAGDYDEALEVLREGLSAFPEFAALHTALGYVRMAREEWVWAKHAFEVALLHDPEDVDAWVGLGETLLKFGGTEAGLDCFAQVGAPAPDNEDVHLAIGRALFTAGQVDAARDWLETLLDEHPASAEGTALLGYVLHAQGNTAGSRRNLHRALRLQPDLPEARVFLGHLLYEEGRLGAALREFDQIPPAEHWDSLAVWRVIQLQRTLRGEADLRLGPWRARLAELEGEADPVDHFLAEIEAEFEASRDG